MLSDNDPLTAGIDAPNSRTINLIGPVSQAGNHGHRQHMMPDHAAAAVPGTISNADPRRLVLGVIDIHAIVLRFTLRIGEDDSAINRAQPAKQAIPPA
ncbi:MAG: hypothetical protein J6S33_02805 [Aeriscardovia sp.]|nr:hypothetical protein [Aeriscardovia sp.]